MAEFDLKEVKSRSIVGIVVRPYVRYIAPLNLKLEASYGTYLSGLWEVI